MKKEHILTLYVTGRTTRSQRAIAQLQRICDEQLDGYQLTVVDVLERPEVAEDNRILATPTLTLGCPPMSDRLVGDMSEDGKVIEWLGITGPIAAARNGDKR